MDVYGYKWVSVKTMLPPTPGEHYLTWMQVGDTGTLVENIYLGDGQWTVMPNRVTHWMDMPEPPRIHPIIYDPTGYEQCPECGGLGSVSVGKYTTLWDMHVKPCPICDGKGKVRKERNNAP